MQTGGPAGRLAGSGQTKHDAQNRGIGKRTKGPVAEEPLSKTRQPQGCHRRGPPRRRARRSSQPWHGSGGWVSRLLGSNLAARAQVTTVEGSGFRQVVRGFLAHRPGSRRAATRQALARPTWFRRRVHARPVHPSRRGDARPTRLGPTSPDSAGRVLRGASPNAPRRPPPSRLRARRRCC